MIAAVEVAAEEEDVRASLTSTVRPAPLRLAPTGGQIAGTVAGEGGRPSVGRSAAGRIRETWVGRVTMPPRVAELVGLAFRSSLDADAPHRFRSAGRVLAGFEQTTQALSKIWWASRNNRRDRRVTRGGSGSW
jgi:hypothetical protein